MLTMSLREPSPRGYDSSSSTLMGQSLLLGLTRLGPATGSSHQHHSRRCCGRQSSVAQDAALVRYLELTVLSTTRFCDSSDRSVPGIGPDYRKALRTAFFWA